jgi:phenylacetate-CoA ligase
MVATALKAWLHRRQRPRRYAFLDGLLKTQALSRAALCDKQREDRDAIVRFARDHTAYYAQRFTDIDSFEALPILTKADVVAHLPDLLAGGYDPHTTPLGNTGGSTGKPLAFYYDETKHELMRAGMMRSYMLAGWRPGQKILNFWGARQDTVQGGVFGTAAWDDFIAAEKTLPAHKIDAAKLQGWADFIRRYRPTLLQGYASILAALARHVIDAKLVMPESLIGAYSTAEVLTDAMRETIERAFGSKVFNQYGSREIPNIACECRHGNMHVWTDMVWLESMDGELLVTSLTNRLMPMIRYANGDCGELLDDECACGLPFPLMAMGLCRSNDFIVAPGGRRLHPSFFNHLLYGRTEVRQYQFVQDAPLRVLLRLVADTPLAAVVAQEMQARVAAEGLSLQIDYVPDIDRTMSGKHRFVISRL